MRPLIIMLIICSNSFACELYYHVEETTGKGFITSHNKKDIGHFVLSYKDYLLYKEYSQEVLLPKYATMNETDLQKEMAIKFKQTEAQLKKMYVYGMVVDEGLKKGIIDNKKDVCGK